MSVSETTDNAVLAHNRAMLLDALRAAGATRAVIAYSGYGGVPNPDDIRIFDNSDSVLSGDQAVAIMQQVPGDTSDPGGTGQVVVNIPVRDALGAFTSLALQIHHPQYEKNEGGTGEVIFDCSDNTVRMEHRDFRIEYVHSDTDL